MLTGENNVDSVFLSCIPQRECPVCDECPEFHTHVSDGTCCGRCEEDACLVVTCEEGLAVRSQDNRGCGGSCVPGNAGDTNLVAYWDSGECGEHGNDFNWAWCGRTAQECPDTLWTDSCPSGAANLVWMQKSVELDGCQYKYYAQYQCVDVEADGNLLAYWDEGGCGVVGEQHNWDWCGRTAGTCAETIDTDYCETGTAALADMQERVTIAGCHYGYYAKYQCMGIIYCHYGHNAK
jgi:hypothetical protein